MHLPVTANVKESAFIKGELTVEEDLTVEGRVEGKIELKDHNLWIGPQGKVYAEIHAKSVIVAGDVIGNIFASEIVEIRLSGSVLGNINCSRISILDGAKFNGSIDTDTGPATAPKLGLQKADAAKMSHSSSLGELFSRF
jgi:cytoskeletal protein CcmA (bactofilin family)